MNQSSNERKVALIALLLLAALFSLLTTAFISHHGKAVVNVVVLPPDSTLTIDGKAAKAGKIYFSKATHTLKASRQYFTTVTKTINFATYNTSQTLYMNPSPDSQQALDYLTKHPEIQAQREAAGGIQAGEAQQQLSKNKLLPFLPYTGTGFEYIVDYGTATQANGTQKITIYIEADTDQAKQNALSWIESKKIDPKSLTIVYEALPTSSSGGSSGEGPSEYQ